jgi:MFS family permease
MATAQSKTINEEPKQMTEPAAGRKSMRSFFILWLGQVISVIGSDLTGFALGVWVFQRTGSVTQFTLIVICTVAPGILLSPLVGALVDRWDRRLIMILSNVASGVSTFVIALLFFVGALQLWHIWILMAAISTSTAFLLPSYSASIALIVPQRHLGRASGLVQFGQAAGEIV